MTFKQDSYHRPLIFNGVLWVLAFVILLFIFAKGQQPIAADYLYTLSFLVTLAIPVSLNFYGLIPFYLKREKNLLYSFLFLLILLGSALVSHLFFNDLVDVLFPSYYFVSYVSGWGFLLFFSIFMVATTLLKLAEDWFYYNTNENKSLKIENQQIQTKLSALRAQINPHFLFNSLNVIYAMAIAKQNDITTAIVELSDILRYVIYDSNTESVSLKEELELIKNYISFQKHRGHSENKIHLEVDIEDENYSIYPLLLLPLIENAYKYGFSGKDASETIWMDFLQKGDEFRFQIKNMVHNNHEIEHKKYSGFGLNNLENNLKLVYPSKHKFEIHRTEETFEVILSIQK
ncbi:MAG: histidine kinase [Bacteroidota bacterium]